MRRSFPLSSVGVTAILFTGIAGGAFLSLFGLSLEGGAIAILGLGPLFWMLDRQLNPSLPMGPAFYIYIYHLLGYVIGPLGERYLSVRGENFSATGMIRAQWGAVLGMTVFACFYRILFRFGERLGRPTRTPMMHADDKRWGGFTIALVTVGTAVTAYAHVTNAFRRLGNFETANVEAQTAAAAFSTVQQIMFLFVALIAARRKSRRLYVFWFAMISAYVVYTFLEGTRGLALVAALLSGMGFILGGVSKKIVVTGFAICSVLFIPASAVVDRYRSTPAYSSRYDEGFEGRADAFASAASDLDVQSRTERTSSLDIFFRAVTAHAVDKIMEYTPDRVPFAGFRDLDRLAYVWVPRLLDPERPTLLDGNEIATDYGMGHDGVRSWVYTPTVGEGYRRFGWIGIPLAYAFAAAVFGFTIGLCWARRRQREWAALLVFSFLQAPMCWSATLLSTTHYLAWVFPKFLVFFYALRWGQDMLATVFTRRSNFKLVAASPPISGQPIGSNS